MFYQLSLINHTLFRRINRGVAYDCITVVCKESTHSKDIVDLREIVDVKKLPVVRRDQEVLYSIPVRTAMTKSATPAATKTTTDSTSSATVSTVSTVSTTSPVTTAAAPSHSTSDASANNSSLGNNQDTSFYWSLGYQEMVWGNKYRRRHNIKKGITSNFSMKLIYFNKFLEHNFWRWINNTWVWTDPKKEEASGINTYTIFIVTECVAMDGSVKPLSKNREI